MGLWIDMYIWVMVMVIDDMMECTLYRSRDEIGARLRVWVLGLAFSLVAASRPLVAFGKMGLLPVIQFHYYTRQTFGSLFAVPYDFHIILSLSLQTS